MKYFFKTFEIRVKRPPRRVKNKKLLRSKKAKTKHTFESL
jgi:hypothetical protein